MMERSHCRPPDAREGGASGEPGRDGGAPGRAAGALAAHPRLGLLALGLLAVAAGLGAARERPSDRFQRGEAWRAAAVNDRDFGLYRRLGLVAVFGPVLAPESEARLRALERELEALPWIGSVVTPFDAPGLERAPLHEAAEHPLFRDTLVQREGRCMLLPFDEAGGGGSADPSARPRDWAAVVERTARRALGPDLEVGVTGTTAIIEAQGRAFARERWRFQVLGALLGFGLAWAAFRDVRASLLAGLPPLLGVALSLGATRLLGLGAAGFTSIVLPLLVLTIGFTDSLHVVVGAARARRAGARSGVEAAARAVRELAWPCALTSLTTAIGFASLVVAKNEVVADFGLSCALSTLLTFVTVIVSIPLLARTPLGASLERVRVPPLDDAAGGIPEPSGAFSRAIDRGVRATLRAPRAVSAAALAVTALLALAASTLTTDRRASTDLAGGSLAARTLVRVDEELGGVFPLHVRIDWDAGVPAPAVLRAVRDARAALAEEPLVQPSLGPDSLVAAVRALPGAALQGRIGDALAFAMLEGLPREWREPFIDVGARRALLHARLPDAGSHRLVPAFARLRTELAAIEGGGIRLALGSDHVAYLESVTQLASDLARSLALAAFSILATLTAAFRSWRIGLASVVPNLFPLAASAAGLAWLDGRIDVALLTALTLSLGIATDDTIHVLARWRRLTGRGVPAGDAARGAVLGTLPALLVTTLTLTGAFALLLTSELPTLGSFGMLASTTLATAFLADVWMLPALLVALAPPSARRESERAEQRAERHREAERAEERDGSMHAELPEQPA